MKKINIKLTLPELQATAIATAEYWIKLKEERYKTQSDKVIKQWKKLSEYLFAIYRINK